MSWGAKTSGFSELDAALVRVRGAGDDDVLRSALMAGGKPIADAARDNVDVRHGTGRLKDSIIVGTELSPAQAALHRKEAPVEVFVGPGPLPEAITEEFGTRYEAPHAYLRPAWDRQQQAASDAIAGAMSDEVFRRAKG